MVTMVRRAFGDGLRWLGGPLARMLALSLSLHAAVLALVRPAPGDSRPVVVIQARLAEPSPPTPPVPDRPAPPPPAPVVEPAAVVPKPLEAPEPKPRPAPPAELITPSPSWETPSPSETSPSVGDALPAPGPRPVSAPASAPAAPSRTTEGSEALLPRVPVPFDTRWYAAREVDVLPRPVDRLRYDYPETARRRGVEGSVLVLLKVDERGRVRDVEVLESTPPGEFDDTVLEVLRRADFTPARREGVPVRTLVKHRVTFELDD